VFLRGLATAKAITPADKSFESSESANCISPEGTRKTEEHEIISGNTAAERRFCCACRASFRVRRYVAAFESADRSAHGKVASRTWDGAIPQPNRVAYSWVLSCRA